MYIEQDMLDLTLFLPLALSHTLGLLKQLFEIDLSIDRMKWEMGAYLWFVFGSTGLLSGVAITTLFWGWRRG